MSDKIELSTFPSSKVEALTMLYLQNQNLSDLSPQELVAKYIEVLEEVRAAFREIRSGKPSPFSF